MSAQRLSGTTALVTGASRGFGRAIAAALLHEGAHVVGLARDGGRLAELHQELGDGFTPVTGDAADPVTAGQLLDRYDPTILVLNAGAAPLSRPLHQHTWQSFSRNWEVDVQHAFNWTREALLRPLRKGSMVVAISSGAVLAGSPLSGGYAGAKATIRYIAAYAAEESERNGLEVRFTTVLPQLTPATDLGAAAVAAYAARAGQPAADFGAARGPALTTGQAGQAIVSLINDPAYDQASYLLTAAGLRALA